jgi:trehalose 6-phosphate phosphatase
MIPTSTERKSSFSPFFRSFAGAKQPTLLLDYDGTLAPFRAQRNLAVPYDGVPEALDEILSQTATRMVVVSGRAARQIPPLLGMRLAVEIWGSHGMERLMPDGQYLVQEPSPRIATAFHRAADQLEARGLSDRVEMKAGSLAVHWRGLDSDIAGEACTTALRVIQPIAFSDGLAVVHFDGGIEMRVRTPNKGDVINTILPGAESAWHHHPGSPGVSRNLGAVLDFSSRRADRLFRTLAACLWR